MTTENLNKALAYYAAMHNKDLTEMGKYLHPEIKFLAPMAQLQGKGVVLAAAENFVAFLTGLTIRAKFTEANQVMLAYDLAFPLPIGAFRVAALLTFTDGLISSIELFYDARPFEMAKTPDGTSTS